MNFLLALLATWILVPILQEIIVRKGLKVTGLPAWGVSVILSFLMALLIMFIFSPFEKSPFNFFAMTAIVYFGQGGFYNVVIKPLRGRFLGTPPSTS